MAKKNENIVEEDTNIIEEDAVVEDVVKQTTEKILVPRRSLKEEPTLFVAINGVSYLVPKGKEVEVPCFVAEEIRRSQAAEDAFFATVDELSVKPK